MGSSNTHNCCSHQHQCQPSTTQAQIGLDTSQIGLDTFPGQILFALCTKCITRKKVEMVLRAVRASTANRAMLVYELPYQTGQLLLPWPYQSIFFSTLVLDNGVGHFSLKNQTQRRGSKCSIKFIHMLNKVHRYKVCRYKDTYEVCFLDVSRE